MIRVATWNLCLGLMNKKDYVYQTLNNESIDICLLQEVEISKNFSPDLLTNRNYKIEIEKNTNKARCAIAIKDNIKYTRRSDLEEDDLGIVIIDINDSKSVRLINLYRQFTPPNNLTQIEHFTLQLQCITNATRMLDGKKRM